MEEIRVGDEIRVGQEYRNAFSIFVFGVRTRLDGVKVYSCMSSCGFHLVYTSEENVHKTGIHIPEIAEVMKKLQEVETYEHDNGRDA